MLTEIEEECRVTEPTLVLGQFNATKCGTVVQWWYCRLTGKFWVFWGWSLSVSSLQTHADTVSAFICTCPVSPHAFGGYGY